MLTKEETDFMQYWEKNRLKEQSVWHQLKSGIYAGILFAIAILAMVFSGWYKRADMTMNSGSGNILSIIIALLVICVVYAIFHKRQQWDRKEQQYTELMIKKKKAESFNQNCNAGL